VMSGGRIQCRQRRVDHPPAFRSQTRPVPHSRPCRGPRSRGLPSGSADATAASGPSPGPRRGRSAADFRRIRTGRPGRSAPARQCRRPQWFRR
jgi:hypothetical protein